MLSESKLNKVSQGSSSCVKERYSTNRKVTDIGQLSAGRRTKPVLDSVMLRRQQRPRGSYDKSLPCIKILILLCLRNKLLGNTTTNIRKRLFLRPSNLVKQLSKYESTLHCKRKTFLSNSSDRTLELKHMVTVTK